MPEIVSNVASVSFWDMFIIVAKVLGAMFAVWAIIAVVIVVIMAILDR